MVHNQLTSDEKFITRADPRSSQSCCGDICPMPHCGPFGECDERGERPVNVGEELKNVIGEVRLKIGRIASSYNIVV